MPTDHTRPTKRPGTPLGRMASSVVAWITTGRSAARRWSLAALAALAVLLGLALSPSGRADPPSAVRPSLVGVNLPGGGFAPERIPGTHGKDYLYPRQETAAPFVALGMNTVRVAFTWERIQPSPRGNLDAAELRRLDAAVAELDGFDRVILDLHNYARYRGAVLDPADGPDLLADVWRRLALHYRDNPKLAFGLMNEPHGIDPAAWRAIVDRTIAAIRKTGAANLLLVPGTHWTGGHRWFEGGKQSNAAELAGLARTDPNLVFEIHQYLDWNSSGQNSLCLSRTVGRDRLAAVTQWLRKEKAQAVLAEFGAAGNPACLAALDDLLAFLDANGDVWRGWTYWAGGDWWGDYPMSIQPDGHGEKPQVAVLRRYLGRDR